MKFRQIVALFCIVLGIVCAYFVFHPPKASPIEELHYYPSIVYMIENAIFSIWLFWIVTSCLVLMFVARGKTFGEYWIWLSVGSGGAILGIVLCVKFFIGVHNIDLAFAIWFLVWFIFICLISAEDIIRRKLARG